MLISSSGITIFEHVCKKKGSFVSFYIKSAGCCTGKKTNCLTARHCHLKQAGSTKQSEFRKAPCCQDFSHFKKENLTAVKQLNSLPVKKPVQEFMVVSSSHILFVNPFDFYISFIPPHYIPPNVARDLIDLFGTIRC